MTNLVSLQRMQVISWSYLAVITLCSCIFFPWTVAWSIFAGGVISILSFVVSYRHVIRFIESLTESRNGGQQPTGAEFKKSGYLFKFWIRIVIIGVVLLLLIMSGTVNVFGLILGLSTIVFTVIFTALSMVRHYYFSGRR